MAKGVNKKELQSNLEKTLGVFSVASIAMSLFMGYNKVTGNVIATGSDYTLLSVGGVILFVLGILGVFLVAKK